MTLAKYLFGAVAALAVLTLLPYRPRARSRGGRSRRGGKQPTIDSGDTAWMLTSTALVLMMTIPGLALFYGGMVRKKNVLAVVMQCFAITCLVTVVWMVRGYSLGVHRRRRHATYIGGLSQCDAQGHVGTDALSGHDPRVGVLDLPDDLRHHHAGAHRRRLRRPHEVLGAGAVHGAVVAHRLCPDRALGMGRRLPRPTRACSTSPAARSCTSTPASPAWSARIFLGKRTGYGTENMAPHNLVYSVIGASLLWVGWFGFNAGSAVAANGTRRHGHGGHADRHGRRGARLDVRRVARAQEAERARHHLGRGRRSRRHHAGVGLRRPGRRACGSASRPASAASSPPPPSRGRSATTIRSTCSASTPSAASSAPF